jgi:rhamnose transport system permease protein
VTASSTTQYMRNRDSWLRRLLSHREVITFGLLVVAFFVSSRLSPYFLDVQYIFDATSLYVEVGVMALAMTFVIISGNIDLSAASMLALVAVSFGLMYTRLGLPLPVAIVLALLQGSVLGMINGLIVTRFKLPSMIVTVGTLALYRGLGQILLGDHAVTGFSESFYGLDMRYVGNSPMPIPLVIFLVLAVFFGLILHKTSFGRMVFAVGTNQDAARYSGIAADRVKVICFAMSGLMAALGAIMMSSRLASARYDMANGWELDVITAVVLGGTDINGGKGSILGTVLALFLIGVLRSGMGLANIKIEYQLVVIGSLLIMSIIIPNIIRRLRGA